MRPTHRAKSTAAAGEMASSGKDAKAAPATHAEIARMTTTSAMTVRWAASFSSATRRLPKGATATKSRLPR